MASTARALTKPFVAELFSNLEVKGQATKFLKAVADNVNWEVKGTHPLAGCYDKKGFVVSIRFVADASALLYPFDRKTRSLLLQEIPLTKISQGLQNPPVVMKVNQISVDGEWAIVEMQAVDAIAKAGWAFDNHYCWICRFQEVHSKLWQ